MSSKLITTVKEILSNIKDNCQKENIDSSNFDFTCWTAEIFLEDSRNQNYREVQEIEMRNIRNVNLQNSADYLKMEKIEESIKKEYPGHCIKLVPEIKVGKKFIPFKSNNLDNDEEVSVNLENGISFINFWRDFDDLDDSQEMKRLFQMVEKNFDKWNGKVKLFNIFSIGTKSKDDIVKTIENNNLNRFPEVVKHLYMAEENTVSLFFKSKLSKHASMVVDHQGDLVYLAPIFWFDGNYFNEILEGKEENYNEDNQAKAYFSKVLDAGLVLKFDAFMQEATKVYKEIISDEARKPNYNVRFGIQMNGKLDCNLEKATVEDRKISKIVCEMFFREKEYEIFKELKEKYLTEDDVKNIEFELKRLETFNVEVPESKACSACQGAIAKEDLTYCCPQCMIFFCAKCVDSRRGKSGFEALVHKEHYLLVFKNPNPEYLVNLDKERLGKNLFAEMKEEDLGRSHGYSCNGAGEECEREDKQERFICMNCRPGCMIASGFIDFCRACHKKMSIFGNGVERKDGHKNNHVYLQLYYAGKDYKEF